MDRPQSGAGPRVVDFAGGNSSTSGSDTPGSESATAQEPVAQELIINGQRYRLVSEEPLAAPAERTLAPGISELLTARELQIVMLVAEGRVNKQIAATLTISEWTVSTHLRRIFAKLGVDTRAAMVCRCLSALASPSR